MILRIKKAQPAGSERTCVGWCAPSKRRRKIPPPKESKCCSGALLSSLSLDVAFSVFSLSFSSFSVYLSSLFAHDFVFVPGRPFAGP